MDIRKILQTLGLAIEKQVEVVDFDSKFYHSKENCGSELDVSRRGNVFCPLHYTVRLCHCGWAKGKHYVYGY